MDTVTQIIVWVLEKVFWLILVALNFLVWLIFWITMVLAKAICLGVSGGKADVRVFGYNHRKAARSLVAESEEGPMYCGWGAWKHRLYVNGSGSQIMYVYATDMRFLIVGSKHGSHEFFYKNVSLSVDDSSGHIVFSSATDNVPLGLASNTLIPNVLRAVNEARSSPDGRAHFVSTSEN